MSGWKSFWDEPVAVFANEAHRQAHFTAVTNGILADGHLQPGMSLLDYGCGDAASAPMLAAHGIDVCLYDRSPHYRNVAAQLAQRVHGIRLLEEDTLTTTSPFDAIVLCSVAQYLSPSEFTRLLEQLSRLLVGNGRLYLIDIIPHWTSLPREALGMIANGLRHGYLLGAIRMLAQRALTSAYGTGLEHGGLSRYDEEDIRLMAAPLGLSVTVAQGNYGINRCRQTYILARQ